MRAPPWLPFTETISLFQFELSAPNFAYRQAAERRSALSFENAITDAIL